MIYGELPIYKSYIKRGLGKLYVNTINPFTNETEGIILSGNPRIPDEECIIDVYNEQLDAYLRRANKRHFDTGDLVPYERKEREETELDKINKLSDEEIKVILGKKFLAIQNIVEKITSITTLFAMLNIAKELDKSQSIIKLIEARIAYLQQAEYNMNNDE